MTAETIKGIREFWKLPAKHMGIICGFGANQWSLYEQGKSTPNASNMNLIHLTANPISFLSLLDILPDCDKEALGSNYNKVRDLARKNCDEIDQMTQDHRRSLSQKWILVTIKH